MNSDVDDGLKPSHRAAIRGVLAQAHRVDSAVLFGSRAMGCHRPASDIDLCLFGTNLTLGDEHQIASWIEDIGLPVRMDLLRHHTVSSQALLEHIVKHGVLFYERGLESIPDGSEP